MAVKKQSVWQAYPGQMVFGAALALCVVLSLVLVASEATPGARIDEVKELSSSVGKKLSSERVVHGPPPAPAASDVRRTWEEPVPLAPMRPWSFHRKPSVTVEVEKREDPRKILVPPVLAEPTQEDYTVTLSWKDGEGGTARVTGYHVYRWTGEAQPPEKPLNDRPLGPDVRTFTDEDYDVLRPLTEVHYAVTALTDQETRSGRKESGLSDARSLQLPDDRKLTFHGKRGVEFAFVTVWRFHEGDYVPHDFMTYLGDPIGKEERVDWKGEKLTLDFTTDCILAYVGKEMKEEKKVRKIPLWDPSGKPQYDENGNQLFEEKVSVIQKPVWYVLVSDQEGRVRRIEETEPPDIDRGPPPEPPESHVLDHLIWELEVRLRQANKNKGPWAVRKRLAKRIRFLRRNRRRILARGSKTEVDEARLFAKGGLLYEYRWEYLKANHKYKKYKKDTYFEEALLLRECIQDVESLLSEAGKEKEKKEWEIDRREFEKYEKD